MILNDVIVEQIAIVASHLQSGVSHKPLKGECIAAAIHQILTSECMPERMDRSPLHTSGCVISHKSLCLFGNDEVGKGFLDGCTHY